MKKEVKILLGVLFLTGIGLGIFSLSRANPSVQVEPAQAQSEARVTLLSHTLEEI